MITEIIRELTVIKRTNEITIKQVLSWAKTAEAQRAQKVILDVTKQNREFNLIMQSGKHGSDNSNTKIYTPNDRNSKYCSTTHEPPDVWCMGETMLGVDDVITLGEYAQVQTGRWQQKWTEKSK